MSELKAEAFSPNISFSGKRKTRPESFVIAPSQTIRTVMRVPSRKRGNPYRAVHNFKRTTSSFGTLTTDSINPVLSGFNFSFNDIPGNSEFTSLFDFYKITGIRVRVMPFSQDGSESTLATYNSYNPPMYYAIDTSDGSAPLWKGIDFYFKPSSRTPRGHNVADGWLQLMLRWTGTVLRLLFPLLVGLLLRLLCW